MVKNKINQLSDLTSNGLNKCIEYVKKNKVNIGFDVAFYVIIISLFLTGVITERFITRYFATMATSKTVKFLMHI